MRGAGPGGPRRACTHAGRAPSRSASEHALAKQEYQRALILHDKGYFPTERLDQRRSELNVAEAGYRAALDDAAAAIDVS
jgi:multidrug resistance efflux pump